VTLKKNVMVITAGKREVGVSTVCRGFQRDGIFRQGWSAPSVRQRATRNSAKGGIPKRAFSVAKVAERNTKGATILKIWEGRGGPHSADKPVILKQEYEAHEKGRHQERAEDRDQAVHRL